MSANTKWNTCHFETDHSAYSLNRNCLIIRILDSDNHISHGAHTFTVIAQATVRKQYKNYGSFWSTGRAVRGRSVSQSSGYTALRRARGWTVDWRRGPVGDDTVSRRIHRWRVEHIERTRTFCPLKVNNNLIFIAWSLQITFAVLKLINNITLIFLVSH